MWEGWKKYVDEDSHKRYQLLVVSGSVEVLLVVYLDRKETEPSTWGVLITAFNPGAGEYILYEGTFSDFAEAEAKAWEEAQSVRASYDKTGQS